jgi:arsenate reductase
MKFTADPAETVECCAPLTANLLAADQAELLCHRRDLPRRLLAELVGTGLLVTVVVGSGIAAQQLSPGQVGLQLLENSTATVLGLAVLILLFGPVSGAHFNPVVSAVDWLLGRRAGTGLSGREVLAYTSAQVFGAVAGAVLANVMFSLTAFQISHKPRASMGLWVGEVVATAGLIALILVLARTGRVTLSAGAVGAYIGAAYWFTSSTSFANPAVTVGRVFSDTFAGIAPASLPGFVLAQLIGGALGACLALALYPDTAAAADRAVVPYPATAAPAHPTMTSPDRSERGIMTDSPEVLFVCVHNAGRSQMAAAVLAHHVAGRVQVRSAGSIPAKGINPAVLSAMAEIGLDLSAEFPKLLTDDAVQAADVVITMGCGDACPVYPGKRYLDWNLPDPAGKTLAEVRPIRDEIDHRVRELLEQLLSTHQDGARAAP